MGNTKRDSGDQSQLERFRDLARELEADESEEAFEATVKKIVQAPKPEKTDEE
ncbi:hypothetical protein [Caulobacter mirabilis]|uniref:hypothetical protein n=1 Tax=Caulobacter mirabilis TaxID=69666 RepID=UPI001559FB96|nr:hypothetical protein [Caulobacter mirabilis]